MNLFRHPFIFWVPYVFGHLKNKMGIFIRGCAMDDGCFWKPMDVPMDVIHGKHPKASMGGSKNKPNNADTTDTPAVHTTGTDTQELSVHAAYIF